MICILTVLSFQPTEPTRKTSGLSSSKQARPAIKLKPVHPTGDTRDSTQRKAEPIQVKDSQHTAQEKAKFSEEEERLRTENGILQAECARLETNWDELFDLLCEKHSRLMARIERLQSENKDLVEHVAVMEEYSSFTGPGPSDDGSFTEGEA